MILKNPTSTRKWYPFPRNSRPRRSASFPMVRFQVAAMVLSLLYMSPHLAAADLIKKKYKIAKAGEGSGHVEFLDEQLGHQDHSNHWDVDGDDTGLSKVVLDIHDIKDERLKEGWMEEVQMDVMGKTSEGVAGEDMLGDINDEHEVPFEVTKVEVGAGIGINFNKGGVGSGSNIQSNKKNKENDGREKDGGSDTVSDVDSPSPVEDQTSSFNFVDDLKRMEKVSSRLRGTTAGDVSSSAVQSSMFSEVPDIAKLYLGKIEVIQKSYHSEDKTAAVSGFKSLISDKDALVEANRYVKEIAGKDFSELFDIDIVSDEDSSSLDEIPNSELEEFIQPQVQVFDQVAEISQDLVNILEGLDTSFISSPMKDPSTRKTSNQDQPFTFESGSSTPGSFKSGQSGFHQSRGQTHPQHDFFSNAALKSSVQNWKARTSRRSSLPKPKLSQFASFLTDDMVNEKHDIRVNAIGADVCRPACLIGDIACNCANLFKCVNDMTKYDLAVLIAGGYLDTDAESSSFGNFTIPGKNLNLFDADDGVSDKLKRVKGLARANNPSDENVCLAVLQEFYSACNPIESTCTITNQQTFQVTTEQVCNAVNSPKKLLFEVIGDEYDDFADKMADAKCQPLSYDTCRSFVSEFDRLYEGRDTNDYPLSNPMRKDPNTDLYLKMDSDIFNHAQFPVGYVFLQDKHGGISRTFTESSTSQHQLFSIVNELDGMALTVSSTCANNKIIELHDHDSGEVRQQFYLIDNGKIVSKKCPGYLVSADPTSAGCNAKKIDLKLWVPFHSSYYESLIPKQEWRFHSTDGTIRNTACPNVVVSNTKHSLEEKIEKVPFSIVNPSNQLAMGLERDECVDGIRIVLMKSNPSDPKQQFEFQSDKVISSVRCPEKVLDAQLHGYRERCDVNHYIQLWEKNGGTNQQWDLTKSGTINGVGKCEGFSMRMKNNVGKNIELAYTNSLKSNEVWNAVSSDLGSLKQLYGPFSLVNPSSDMAFAVRDNHCDNGILEVQKYDISSVYQQFYLGDDGVLFSASCSGKVVGFDGSCKDHTSVRLLGRSNQEGQRWKFKNDRIVSASDNCKDFIIGIKGGLNMVSNQVTAGTSLVLRTGKNNWDEHWDEKSNDVSLLPVTGGSGQKWRTEFFEELSNYDYALLPGFPGAVLNPVVNGCYGSAKDPQTASDAMHSCDESMALLVGSQSSVGTLRAIAKLVGTNPEHMPGACCMDNAANSQYFGYDYDPREEGMSCQNKGPWHLGISEEACENAGGQWTRSPCVTLKACIDSRPKNGTDAYSPSFEKFARGIDITDASDESKCQTAREKLDFDRDYPYDTEVCETFNSELCDQLYTEVDIMTDGLDKDLTWTHIHYEPPNYPQDERLKLEPLPDIQDFIVPNDIGVFTEKLVDLRATSLSLQHVQWSLEQAKSLNDFIWLVFCEMFVSNIGKAVCGYGRMGAGIVFFVLDFIASLSHQVLQTAYEEAQLGDGEQIDIYTYSRALFENSEVFTQWNTEALGTINKNMASQHIQMRDQLQVRHTQMSDCITCTIVSAINVLGCKMAEFNGGDTCDESTTECHNTSCPKPITPFNVQWPVGQPNLIEKMVDNIQKTLESTGSTLIGAHNVVVAGTEAKDMEVLKVQMEAIEGKMDAFEDKMDTIEGMASQLLELLA